VLALAYASYSSLSPDAKFWDNFWPNFWSDLVVGIIVAAIISWAITKSKRIEASIIADANELEADVIAKETDSVGPTHLVKFAVRNTCDHCLSNEGIYWHLFIERSCYIDIDANELSTIQHEADREIEGKAFRHVSGLLSAPVFPKRYVEIAQVRVRAPRNQQTDLRYFLSTAHGIFPKNMRIDQKGNPDIRTSGKVVIV
jgi:hypothetical protein